MTRQLVIDVETGSTELGCIWCDRMTAPWTTRTFQGSVYVCTCGAMVLFAPPHDFDEAAEELLDHLKVSGEVAEPLQAVGATGMLTARHYDGAASRRQLAAVLTDAGNETRTEDVEIEFVRSPERPRRMVISWGLWWRAGR